MLTPILLASSLLVVVLAVALAREVRLRRALQALLTKLMSLWRKRNDEPVARRGDADDVDGAAGPRDQLH